MVDTYHGCEWTGELRDKEVEIVCLISVEVEVAPENPNNIYFPSGPQLPTQFDIKMN